MNGSPFGSVELPSGITGVYGSDAGIAIGRLINFALRALIVGAGIYALITLVIAGYSFMAAGDDPKKVAGAWQKIWQTLIGLAFAAGAFVLAAIFGQLIFGDPTFILKPTLPTP
jgi:hypothetical protein